MTNFGNYDPSSFGWKTLATGESFSYKQGMLSVPFPSGVAPGTAPIWEAFLNELVPMIPGGLKIGTCWGQEPRNIAGTSTKSFHAYGLALDVNAPYNGRGGAAPTTPGQYQISKAAGSIAKKYGMEWGGDWSYTDLMHFELHMSPDEVKAWKGDGTTSTPSTPSTATSGTGLPGKVVLGVAGAIAVAAGIAYAVSN